VIRESVVQADRSGGHETVVKRVSRKHDDHGHGGAWKVAFADFCLALLCLFLVLWLMAAKNAESLQNVLLSAGGRVMDGGSGVIRPLADGSKGSLIERFSVPTSKQTSLNGADGDGEHEKGQLHADEPVQYDTPEQLQDLAKRIEQLGEEEGLAGNISSVITPQGLRLMLHDTDERGMFDRGSAMPSERFRALLRKIGPMFIKIKNQLLIVGHTDAAPYSDTAASAFSNWTLSNHRAMAARFHLLKGGMPDRSILQVSGMADSALLDPAHPLASGNRRIEMIVLTREQSHVMATMFGKPQATETLDDAVDVEGPKAARQLRSTLQVGAAH
jgi:chemotaxis protein MotB